MDNAIVILEEATEEAHEAWQWYAARSPQAADRFQQALDDAIADIRSAPGQWPPYVHGTRYRSLHRFPYLVVYREAGAVIQVIAVAHAHRREGYWKRPLAP